MTNTKYFIGSKTMKYALILAALFVTGCNDARVASHNISKASDMFEIDRRIVFYNGITGDYMLTIEGRCSIKPMSDRLAVTCKTGNDDYKKHYLGLSDNVTYFAEQLAGASVSVYHYRVIFKPETIVPDIDLRTSLNDKQ